MNRALLLCFFAILLAPVSSGQVTYVSPQTVSQKIFSAQTTATVSPAPTGFPCTPSNGSPCGIPNLGQSIHAITYTIANPCTTGFSMDLRIEASNDGATWFAISEDATDQNSGSIQGATTGGLTATGSYAAYRVNLSQFVCASGQTPAITIFYSGTSTSNPTSVGAFYQSSPIRKLVLQNQPTTSANTQPAVTVNAANGNTAGGLYISCFVASSGASTACPSGMSVTLTSFIAFGSAIGGGGGGNIVSSSTTYSIPSSVAPILQVANAPAISMTFSFAGAGSAGVNWSIYYVATSTPTSNFASDPCLSNGIAKSSVPISVVAASTTQLIAAAGGQKIYPCAITIDANVNSSSVESFQFISGTGVTCGTGSVTLTGAMLSGASTGTGPIAFASAGPSLLNVPAGNALCLVVAQVAGTNINVSGWVTYVQQ